MKAYGTDRMVPQQRAAVRGAIDTVMTTLWPQTSKVAECPAQGLDTLEVVLV